MPQSGDSDLWPTNDDDNPRKSSSGPVKDAVTHQLPVPDQQEKPATAGWFDPPKAEEPAPGRDESHAKPTQQRTQPVSWPVADLEKQASNQSQAATSFARPVPTAAKPAPAWPHDQDTSKGKELTQSSQSGNGRPKPAEEEPQPEPSPAEEKPASRDWFAPAAPEQPADGADREAEHSAAAQPTKGDTTVNLFQPEEPAPPSEPEDAAEPEAATPPEDADSAPQEEPAGQDEATDQDEVTPPEEADGEPVKDDEPAESADDKPADEAPTSSEGDEPAKGDSTVHLFPLPTQDTAEPATPPTSADTKSSNAANLFPPKAEDPAKSGNTTNLFPPPQADRGPKPPEDKARSSNVANLFPPPQRETGEPADRTSNPPEGADSKTVFMRPVPPPRPPVADAPPTFIRPRQSPSQPNIDPATVHIPRADLQKPPKEWPPPEPPRAAPQRVGPPPEEPPAPRKKKPLLVAGIAIVAVLALAAGVVFGVPGLAEKLGLSGGDDPAIAAPPSPVSYSPGLRGPDTNAPAPSKQGVESVLAGPMSNSALGNVAGVVIDPATGETLYERGGGTPITPASTGKLLTAAAALLSLDHTQQLVTKVVQGDKPDEVIIVGGGDPTINSLDPGQESMYPGSAYLTDLVDQVKSLGNPISTVYIDQSRYADPTMAPSWDPADIGNGYIAPIVPAMLDGDRQDPRTNYSQRTSNPGGKLVDTFAARIGATAPENAAKKAPANAKVLAEIRSAPMSQLVDTMLNHSDNTLGDIVAHEVAIKAGEEPSFDGASKAVLDVLRANNFDVDGVVLRDGSGMSTENKVSAKLLAQILAVAAAPDGKDPRTGKLRPLLGGLPVAGGGGTLEDRYDEGTATAGRGWVRAKTGSLTGINSLAGIVLDKDNRPLVFAFLTTGTTSTTARPALDTVSAALRGCGCQ